MNIDPETQQLLQDKIKQLAKISTENDGQIAKEIKQFQSKLDEMVNGKSTEYKLEYLSSRLLEVVCWIYMRFWGGFGVDFKEFLLV